MIKQGVGVIIIKQSSVLLGKRISRHGFGTWCFPGGKIEPDESIEECAIRETREETGIHINNVKSGPHNKSYFEAIDEEHITYFVFASCHDEQPGIMEPDKFSAWAWFDITKLPHPLFLPIENLLMEYKSFTQLINAYVTDK